MCMSAKTALDKKSLPKRFKSEEFWLRPAPHATVLNNLRTALGPTSQAAKDARSKEFQI